MKEALDKISILGSFLIVFSILFLIQNLTIGQIEGVKDITIFKVIHLKDIVFVAISLLIISKFVVFYLPDRSDLD